MSKDLKEKESYNNWLLWTNRIKFCKELNNYDVNIYGIDYVSIKEDNYKNFYYYQCDLTKEEEVNIVIERIYKKINKVDCLVHLAGIDYKIESGIKKETLI